jgi:hypothetical protein
MKNQIEEGNIKSHRKENIVSNFNSKVIDNQKDLIHKIELKTNNVNDICVLCCAAFDEIINHVIFFDDCINEIVYLFILKVFYRLFNLLIFRIYCKY